MQEAPWLSDLVAPHLERTTDRLALALVSRDVYGSALPWLYDKLQARTSQELYDVLKLVVDARLANRVCSLRLLSLDASIALLAGRNNYMLWQCQRLRQLDLQLSEEPIKVWPGHLLSLSLSVNLLNSPAKLLRRLEVIRASLPSNREVAAYSVTPEVATPLSILDYIVKATAPREIYLRGGCLSSSLPIAESLRYLEITQSTLLARVLLDLLWRLRPQMTLSLIDVRLQLCCRLSHLPTVRDQPTSAWLEIAYSLDDVETGRQTPNGQSRGARLIISCSCDLPGQRAHLPGGHNSEAVPGLKAALTHSLDLLGIEFVVQCATKLLSH